MNRKVQLFFVAIIIINLIFNGQFQLHYDEVYYWVWSQNLRMSYFDHPPMIAYMIRLASFFGHGEFFVRLPALVTTAITVLVLYKLALRMFNQKIADITAILLLSCPLIQGMFFIVTPDSPLLMFWALTLYALYIGLFENKVLYIYLAGFFAGCALLSKYTGILIFPSVFLFLIVSKEFRHYLLKKDIYLAFILALLVFSPVIIWNYQHEWASLAFQINHGVDSSHKLNLQSFGDFWGGAVILVSPIIFITMFIYIISHWKTNIATSKLAFLLCTCIFGFLFFAYCSFYKHTEANWPAPVYLSGIILTAYWLSLANKKWVCISSVVFIFIVLLICKLPLVFIPRQIHNKIPAINNFFGEKENVMKLRPYIKPDTVLLACDYGNASRAMYYLGLDSIGVPYKLPFSNEFRYLNQEISPDLKNAIYICDNEDPNALDIMHSYFRSIHLVKALTYSNKVVDSKLYIYQVNN